MAHKFSLTEEKKVSRKRVQGVPQSPEIGIESAAVKRLRDNLLYSFDDDTEIYASSQDLDSFMKSFEKEINASPSAAVFGGAPVEVLSGPGECGTNLGYLLEASDDELGIPPPVKPAYSAESVRVGSDPSVFGGGLWEIPGWDGLGSGFGEPGSYHGEYAPLDGFFDFSDMGLGAGEYPWRPETLPAL